MRKRHKSKNIFNKKIFLLKMNNFLGDTIRFVKLGSINRINYLKILNLTSSRCHYSIIFLDSNLKFFIVSFYHFII